jgi:hypothetical protein
MQVWQAPIFDRLGKALHERFDPIANDPLPERWVDLIQRLNVEEQALSQRDNEPNEETRND